MYLIFGLIVIMVMFWDSYGYKVWGKVLTGK